MAEIAYDEHSLQEHLRQNHRGAYVQINTSSVELFSHSTEQAKISIAGLSKGLARGLGMCMNDVGPNCHMHGNRHLQSVCLRQNAHCPILEFDSFLLSLPDKLSQRLAQSDAVLYSLFHGGIHVFACFAGHAKAPFHYLFLDFFRCCTAQCHFKIMDCRRPIHCNAGHKPGLHQVVDDGAQANLDNMTAESPDHRLTRCLCVKKGSKQIPQAFSSENVWKF